MYTIRLVNTISVVVSNFLSSNSGYPHTYGQPQTNSTSSSPVYWVNLFSINKGQYDMRSRSVLFNFVILFVASLPLLLFGCSDRDRTGSPGENNITNSIGIEFVLIPAGEFVMGEALRTECNTCNAESDETPRHSVRISNPFYISKYEVTQKQWLAIMNSNPSAFKGKNRPVENVSWDNIQLFIASLNVNEKTEAYRLPTEAEWEYVARAGSQKAYSFGDNPSKLKAYGWYAVTSGARTHPVGRLKPNRFGVYDMHGNVFEWCQDQYGADYYAKSPQRDPRGPSIDAERVRRGGGWGSSGRICRSANRDSFASDYRASNTGFRLVKEKR